VVLLAAVAALSLGCVGSAPARSSSERGSWAVGIRVVRWIDRTRTIALPGGRTEPRPLITTIRYPALGGPGGTDLAAASPDRGGGPYPLIVFGHGYSVTAAPYRRLLRAWVRAGYVVAAPTFPLENANAPGGPNEDDLVNQPRDMSFVVSQLLAASRAPDGPLSGLIDPARIAVAGHSDGAETALAVAYDSRFSDRRIRAAVILSGARIPGGTLEPAPARPLLAVQGTADTINPEQQTQAFFRIAARPKFLLTLLGAGHLPPYTSQEPQLHVVERVTTAFFDFALKGAPLGPLTAAGDVRGIARLTSNT
jgi:dienelactone hydrolase